MRLSKLSVDSFCPPLMPYCMPLSSHRTSPSHPLLPFHFTLSRSPSHSSPHLACESCNLAATGSTSHSLPCLPRLSLWRSTELAHPPSCLTRPPPLPPPPPPSLPLPPLRLPSSTSPRTTTPPSFSSPTCSPPSPSTTSSPSSTPLPPPPPPSTSSTAPSSARSSSSLTPPPLPLTPHPPPPSR